MALTENQAQAIHEAGHAVVAHFLGIRVLAIQWVGTGARTVFDVDFSNPQDEQQAANALTVQVAGYAAMRKAGVAGRLLVSEYLRSGERLHPDSDAMQAICLIDRVFHLRGKPSPVPMPQAIACVEWAEQRAIGMLDQSWAAVENVASAQLAGKGIIGEEELHQIIGRLYSPLAYSGTVVMAAGADLVMKTDPPESKEIAFKLDPDTVVTINGQPASVSDLKPEMRVGVVEGENGYAAAVLATEGDPQEAGQAAADQADGGHRD